MEYSLYMLQSKRKVVKILDKKQGRMKNFQDIGLFINNYNLGDGGKSTGEIIYKK